MHRVSDRSSRRSWLKGLGLALLGGSLLSRLDKVAAMQKAPTLDAQAGSGGSEKLLLDPQPGEEGPPAPADCDRLPLEWNKACVKRFFERLAEHDCEAFLVRDRLNTICLTGYWHTTTEIAPASGAHSPRSVPG
jgi:hypothetical protein